MHLARRDETGPLQAAATPTTSMIASTEPSLNGLATDNAVNPIASIGRLIIQRYPRAQSR